MEYAQEYTKKEKTIRILLTFLLGFSGCFLSVQWLVPVMKDFGERPHCYELFGFNGADYLWHIIFIAMPALFFLVTAFALIPKGIASLKEGRFPPSNVKVYKPTRVKRGAIARITATFHLAFPLILLAVVILVFQQINKMPAIDKNTFDAQLCSENQPNIPNSFLPGAEM